MARETENQRQYLVRMTGGYALQFFPRGYGVVADDEATLFDRAEDAEGAARAAGLHPKQWEIEEKNQNERKINALQKRAGS